MKETNGVVYWGIADQRSSPGICNKITDFATAANAIGYKTGAKICPPSNYFNYLISLIEVVRERKYVSIFRYNNTTGLPLFFVAIILRMSGRRVVFDVPTPISSHLRSIKVKDNKTLKDYIELILGWVLTPIIFLAPNLILHYSLESKYFSVFSRNKSIIIGNGIDVNAWPEVSAKSKTECLSIIAVGAIAKWHSWDKVIEAIDVCFKLNPQFKIKFTVVGDGPELVNLRNLTSKLALSDVVKFTGMLAKPDLVKLYREADLGVGTFGWDTIGIKVASPLKYREYLANGLPVIYTTEDPDLIEGNNVAFKVDGSVESIVQKLLSINSNELPSKVVCRQYCKDHMDYRSKILLIMKLLNK